LVTALTLTPGSRCANIIENFSQRYATEFLLRAQVNSGVAQSNSVGQAGVQAAKGAANWTFFTITNKIGTWLTTFSWAPVKAAGEMLKNAGLLDMLYKAVFGDSKPQTQA
jgi:hypothetical protein